MLQGLVRCYACIKVPEKSRFSDSCGSRSMNLPYKSPGGGDSAYEMGGDAPRLAKGCKFQILLSLRVFWAKRHHI